MHVEELLEKLNPEPNSQYPCEENTVGRCSRDGALYRVTTVRSQLRLRKGQEWDVWSPVLYQNCMEPEIMEIRPLTVENVGGGRIYIGNKYRSTVIELDNTEIQICPWEAKIQKCDCRHCSNCGRCGW